MNVSKNKKQNTSEIPNKRLIKALKEAEAIENGKIKTKKYKNFEEILIKENNSLFFFFNVIII